MNFLRADSLSCSTGAPRLRFVHRRSPGHICWTTEGLAQLKKQTNNINSKTRMASGQRRQNAGQGANQRKRTCAFYSLQPCVQATPPRFPGLASLATLLVLFRVRPNMPLSHLGSLQCGQRDLRNHTSLSFCCPLLMPL